MNTDRQGLDSLPVCVMENAGTRRTLQWQKNVKLCREFRILTGIAGKEFCSVKTIVCVDNRMGICFNGRRVSRDRMVSEDILEMTRGNVLWMAPEADKLFKEVFKAKEEVCQETGTGKKIQDAGHLEDEKMWKVDRNFLEKAEEEDFCFVEGENLAGYEGKITEIVLYKWNRDYPADVFFEVDLSKWRLEREKIFPVTPMRRLQKKFTTGRDCYEEENWENERCAASDVCIVSDSVWHRWSRCAKCIIWKQSGSSS